MVSLDKGLARGIVLLALFVFSFLSCQSQIDSSKQSVSLVDQLKYLPSGSFLKGATLSCDSVVADLLWIKTLAYFGGQYVSGHDYSWLYYMLDTVTTLDPHYLDPYEFGGIVLANEAGNVNQSSFLLKKGMHNVSKDHPRYWYLPFFLAYNHWYYKKDYKSGAKYLEIASRFSRAPAYLPMLTARMYADVSQADMALPFLNEMIKTAKSSARRAELLHRKKEVIVNRDLDNLDQAIQSYKKQFGQFPVSLNELVQQEFIKRIPVEPFGGRYSYDVVLHRANSTRTDRIEVYESKIFN